MKSDDYAAGDLLKWLRDNDILARCLDDGMRLPFFMLCFTKDNVGALWRLAWSESGDRVSLVALLNYGEIEEVPSAMTMLFIDLNGRTKHLPIVSTNDTPD